MEALIIALAPSLLSLAKVGIGAGVAWIAAKHHSSTVQAVAQATGNVAIQTANATAGAVLQAMAAGANSKQIGDSVATAARQAALQGAIQGVQVLAQAASKQAETAPAANGIAASDRG